MATLKRMKCSTSEHSRDYQSFHGLYLICNGGYLCWPCLLYRLKTGLAGSQTMRWSAMFKSVRKDIEGVFGIWYDLSPFSDSIAPFRFGGWPTINVEKRNR